MLEEFPKYSSIFREWARVQDVEALDIAPTFYGTPTLNAAKLFIDRGR